MRAVWTAAILAAGIAPPSHAQATQAAPFIATPSDLALQGLLAGSYTTDSLDIRVHVDSARFWMRAPSDGTGWLGGLALGIAEGTEAGWTIDERSRYLVTDRAVSQGDTVLLHDMDFVVSRARVRNLPGHWLVFSMATGGLDGRKDVPALAFSNSQTPHDLFAADTVAAARRPPKPEPSGDVSLRRISCPDVSSRPELHGRIMMTFVVGTDGDAELPSIRARDPSDRELERSAVQVILGCRFQPARIDGRVVRLETSMPLVFR